MAHAKTAVAALLSVLLSWPGVASLAAPPRADDSLLSLGVRQVDEGDFEGAIVTLEPLADRLAAGGGSDAAQASLHLAIAHLALGHRDVARARFRQALDHQPGLRLAPERYSPKVLVALEEARREREAALSSGTGGRRRSRSRTLLLAGGGVAAGVAIALLAGRGSAAEAGSVSFTAARFAPPTVTCENGMMGSALPIGIDVDATNNGEAAVRVTSVSSTLIVVASPAVPQEIGWAGSTPTTATPSSLARGTTTLHLRTTLACYNGEGDEPRYSDWQARLTLVTAAGAVALETSDRLRINIP